MVSGTLGTGAGVAGGVAMADVDFFDEQKTSVWAVDLDKEKRSAIASRLALRALPQVLLRESKSQIPLLLFSMKCILNGFCAWRWTAADAVELNSNAQVASVHLLALSPTNLSEVSSIAKMPDLDSIKSSPENYAARSASYVGYEADRLGHFAAAAWYSFSAIEFEIGKKASHRLGADLVGREVDLETDEVLKLPLWQHRYVPANLDRAHQTLLEFLNSDPNWAFWRRWYEQMWEGTFRDWDLAIEIAKIPDDVWEGDDALANVAAAIRGIEAARKDTDAFERVQPENVSASNVTSLFQRAPVVQASMASMSEAITLRLDAFTTMARPNEHIQFVETLRSMPDTAQRIYDILEKGPDAPGAETALALEVGRLRAENEQLKCDLRAAHAEIDELRKKPWFLKSQALLTGSVLSALGLALWTISEDGFDGEGRWNNTAEELAFLWSKVQPEPQYALPESVHLRFPDLEDD